MNKIKNKNKIINYIYNNCLLEMYKNNNGKDFSDLFYDRNQYVDNHNNKYICTTNSHYSYIGSLLKENINHYNSVIFINYTTFSGGSYDFYLYINIGKNVIYYDVCRNIMKCYKKEINNGCFLDLTKEEINNNKLIININKIKEQENLFQNFIINILYN